MDTLASLLESEDVLKTLGDELVKNIYVYKEELIACFVQVQCIDLVDTKPVELWAVLHE